jgi:hypothetical protein
MAAERFFCYGTRRVPATDNCFATALGECLLQITVLLRHSESACYFASGTNVIAGGTAVQDRD